VSDKKTDHRPPPATDAAPAGPPDAQPDRPRIIRRDTVQRPRRARGQPVEEGQPIEEGQPGKETGSGSRRAPSAAKRGGKPWAMAPAELSAAIDALAGGNHTRFARVCGVHDRTVRSWLAGKPAIPKAIQVLVAALRRLDDAAREEIVREAGAIE
jgi:hypothetical protein